MNEFIDLMKRIVTDTMIKEKTNYRFPWFEIRVKFCFGNAKISPVLNNGMKKGSFLKVEKDKAEFSTRSPQKSTVNGLKDRAEWSVLTCVTDTDTFPSRSLSLNFVICQCLLLMLRFVGELQVLHSHLYFIIVLY